VKPLHAGVLFVLGFVVAGAFSGVVIADVTTSTTTGTTTAVTTTTATTTTTTTPVAPALVPGGVRVAGVRVGGLTAAAAVAAVQQAFAQPLPVVVDHTRFLLDPRRFASAYANTAVAKARIAGPGTNVPLVVSVRGTPLRAWVAQIVARYRRAPVDAKLAFRNGKPVVRKERAGRAVAKTRLTALVSAALASNSRLPVHVRTRTVAPTVTLAAFKHVIVINRSINRLFLYQRSRLERAFRVATGQAIYPTPAGTWHIVVKWKNPWWYPPTQDAWARGLKPVPPGPDNPLGTRWMGLDAPGVGIHGTDEPASIGYSASHGCIRMQVPDAEWLFTQVDVGTTVHII
jgi:lipoprotein-anchoring transpeptidase ErfK/SrfK